MQCASIDSRRVMPEKTVQEVVAFVREQFEKGKAAYNRQNFDYAIDIFNAVLKLEPALFEARTALRATQFQRFKEGQGFLKKMFGKASASPGLARAQMLIRRNPLEAIHAAEQVLNGDPNNVTAHRILAEAAIEADLPKTAVFSLEIAIKQNPTDKKLILQTASAYANAGQITKAESLYSEALKSSPNDPELQQVLKDLSARRTMAEGGYDSLESGNGSYRNVLRDQELAVSIEQEGRSIHSADVSEKLIGEHLAKFALEPGNMKLARTISDLYVGQKAYDRALEFLQKIKESNQGGDPSLDKRVTGVLLIQIDERLAALDSADVDFEDDRRKLLQQRLELEIDSARQLVGRYPSELQYRFDLGEILFKAGKTSEAIQEFQKAQASPHRRAATLNYLGQCFAKRGMYDVAVRTFQKALDEKTRFDDEKKDLVYHLGLAQEAMGKREESIESFKQIYEVDIGFRDVAARVDAYYADQT